MKETIFTTAFITFAIIGLAWIIQTAPNPCDTQCKIAGIEEQMKDQCYEGRNINRHCVEFYNEQLAELSTLGD